MINRRNFFKILKKNKVIILVITAIVISGVYFALEKTIDSFIFNSNNEIEVIEDIDDGEEIVEIAEEEIDLVIEEIEGNVIEEEDIDVIEEEKIYVYVTGEVNCPGVVILNVGSRIADAINAAGGTTPNANISKINLVYILEDGMKVNIPNNKDLTKNQNFEYITMNSGDGVEDSDIKEESSKNGASNNIVNINTASQTELESLPGIGPSLALKIINYRKENGKFSSIEEIQNVSGIGENKFKELKSYITIN